jgi:class 3 adenylate cyclase
MRVLRAAIALAKAAPREQTVRIALHTGPVALVAVNDGLHGDQGHALVPGESVNTVAALEEFAAASGWRIAASQAMARTLANEARTGRRETTARGEPVIEIVGLANSP